eukprot:6276753-Alexandrium_andersonii.AAC.1
MVCAGYDRRGNRHYVLVHDAGKTLIAMLRHNPFSFWDTRNVDPAGWVSVHDILAHPDFQYYPFFPGCAGQPD